MTTQTLRMKASPFTREMLNTGTSALFLATILALVSYLTITRRDQTPVEAAAEAEAARQPSLVA